MQSIKFTVLGKSEPAGSKRAIPVHVRGKPLIKNGRQITRAIDDNPKAGGWKQEVKLTARQAYSGPLLEDALILRLKFYRVRPKGHFRSGKNAHLLRADAPEFPTSKPDVLKTTRAIEDALTGVVWRDDAQIVREVLSKDWGEPARVEVEIEVIAPAARTE